MALVQDPKGRTVDLANTKKDMLAFPGLRARDWKDIHAVDLDSPDAGRQLHECYAYAFYALADNRGDTEKWRETCDAIMNFPCSWGARHG